MHLPPSKSIANRILVLSFLSGGIPAVQKTWGQLQQQWQQLPDDIQLMYIALKTLASNALPITINASDAGTVLRFLLPLVAMHIDIPVKFIGSERLFQRPLTPLIEALTSSGAKWSVKKNSGILTPPPNKKDHLKLTIDAEQSSQFISGLAMSIAGLKNGGTISWNTPLASAAYLTLTQLCLQKFNCNANLQKNSIEIPGNSLTPLITERRPLSTDWSAAAVALCAAAILGKQIKICNLNPKDGQPDIAILEILRKVGCEWYFENETCIFTGRLKKGIHADLNDCPDLAPPLATLAVFAPNISKLSGLSTLPHKESDRIKGIIRLVEWFGGRVETLADSAIKIFPTNTVHHTPAHPFDPDNDHRLVFAAAIGALLTGGTILNQQCTSKSWPGFTPNILLTDH
ncbi:MAG: hypothetical protein FWG02_10410 [Holophagaceae bacterium]|nr:hypothetical protein [Holophagaceae bacterium]